MAMDGAIGDGVVFLEHFRDLPDPRQPWKVVYPLAEAFTDIARFGVKTLDLLRRFLPFRDGTPAHDHLGDTFATLDAERFQQCFVA